MDLIHINNTEISFPKDDNGTYFVPIKPICNVLAINPDTQLNAIKEHPTLGSVTALRAATGSDGKQYEMSCLPLKYAMAWILGIDARNVKDTVKESLLKYQNDCYDAIYEKFFLEPQLQKEKLLAITQQELLIAELKSQRAEINDKIKSETSKLYDIKNAQPTQLALL